MVEALSFETYQKFDKKEITREEFLIEAERIGAIVGKDSNITNWKPDTCKCHLQIIIEGHKVRVLDSKGIVREVFVRDPSIDEHAGQVFARDRFHSQIDPQEHFNTVMSENRLKNYFEKAIREGIPEIVDSITGRIKGDTPYLWSFDDVRRLVVDISKFKTNQKMILAQLVLDPKFSSKVILVG